MDVREKLVELLDDIQLRGEDFTDYEIYGIRLPDTVSNEDVASHLIANGVTVQEWISVKDRLPQGADGKSLCEMVVAYLNNGEVVGQVCTGWLNGDKWYLIVGCDDYYTVWGLSAVTHWMPLPKPPKGE